MLHFSCDVCGLHLNERRFVVKLEVFPAFDPDQIGEEDLDADHLSEIAQILEHSEETGSDPVEDCGPKEFRFDLCPNCHRKFVKDPLGRDAFRRLNFSKN